VRRFSINFAIFSIFLDTVLTLVALLIAVALRPDLPAVPFLQPTAPEIRLPGALYVVVPLLYVAVFLISSLYDPKHVYRLVDELQTLTLASAFASLCFAGLLYLSFDFRGVSRWLFIIFVGLNLVLLVSWRLLARIAFRALDTESVNRRVIIVGAGEEGQQVARMIQEYDWMSLDLVGFVDDRPDGAGQLPLLGQLRDIGSIVQANAVDDVVIALPPGKYHLVNQFILTLHDLPVNARMVPDYFSLALYRAQAEDFGGLPMISLRDPAMNDVERLVKRLMDLALGLLFTLLGLPLLGLIALAIKLDSRGPIIFRQQRVGENGQLFTMYKFRTMVVGAERMQPQVIAVDEEGQIIHKRPNDPRITRIGAFLRRTSLDELPNLFNVLKGEMSLVGPRPELPWLAAQYEPWQRKRFAVPQGITGWWQVNGRSDKPMHLHTEDDLYYVQHYSLWMDLYILLKTVLVVLRGRGAY
jgi:exopolysaccharide biosynthesis polyprenyl glycosylphosphotransferase